MPFGRGRLCCLYVRPPGTDDCLLLLTARVTARGPPKGGGSSALSIQCLLVPASGPPSPSCSPPTLAMARERDTASRRSQGPNRCLEGSAKCTSPGRGWPGRPPECSSCSPGSWVWGQQLGVGTGEPGGAPALPLTRCVTRTGPHLSHGLLLCTTKAQVPPGPVMALHGGTHVGELGT